MRLRQSFSLVASLIMIAALVACGGGSNSSTTTTPPAVISVSVAASATSVTANATLTVTATVTNDSSNSGVTWTVTCSATGTGACGSVSPTSTASGTATTFTAPPAVPTGNTVTVTATSAKDTTKSASATITITAAVAPITVTLVGVPSTLNTSAPSMFSATTNDAAGVTWTVTCGSAGACGSFNPASTLTTVSTTYTAPSAVPTGNTVTVTATSVTSPTVAASASITITTPATITVAISGAPASMTVSTTAPLTATVTNDSSNAGVTWSVACGSTGAGACGTFSAITKTSVTYTAPAAVPTGNTVTVTATSKTDTTKSASATITINPVFTVTLVGVPTTLVTSATVTFSATTNDTAGVNWTVICGSAGACGSFNPTSTLTTVSTTYTAPSAVPTGNTVTVTATSVTDSSKSASANITITAPVITVSLVGVPTTLAVNAIATFSATTNDTAGVSWSCTPSGSCGSFNPATTLTGVDTTYTAPAAVPSGNKVTVIATSVTDTTKSASAKITITPVSPLADGSYVFSLAGTNATGNATNNGPSPYFVAGQFVVSGGLITSGEQDYSDLFNEFPDAINPTGSTISTTADGNFQITLVICNGQVASCSKNNTAVGVSGVETLNGSLVSSTKGRIIEFDSSATSNGTLDLQTTTAAPSGGYAFVMNGVNASTPPFGLSFGGVINVDGSGTGTISGAGSVFDINNGGVVTQSQTFAASTFTGPDASGRFVMAMIPTSSSLFPFNLVGYTVDSTHVRLVEGLDHLGGTTGGTALVQGTNTGQLSTAFASGDSYVVGMVGADANGALHVAGLLTATSTTGLGGTISYNDLTQIAAANPITGGTYALSSIGRLAMTGVTDGTLTFNINLYLDGNGNAVEMTADPSPGAHVVAGGGYQQQAGAFSAGSFKGNYVLSAGGVDPSQNEFGAVGVVTADGLSAINPGFVDLNFFQTSTAAVPTADVPLTGSFTSATNGVFTGSIAGLNVTANLTYYLIDSTRLFAIETDTNQLTLGYFELQ
jgi:hypothetical protein